MATTNAKQQFLSVNSKENYAMKVLKAFLRLRRESTFSPVLESQLKERVQTDYLNDESKPIPGGFDRCILRSLGEMIEDGVLEEKEKGKYDLTDYGHDLLEGAHKTHRVSYEAISHKEECTIVREMVWHFPSTEKRRKSLGRAKSSAPGDGIRAGSAPAGGLPRNGVKRPRGSAPRRSLAPPAHDDDEYPPLESSLSRRKRTFTSDRMEVDPLEPRPPSVSGQARYPEFPSAGPSQSISHPTTVLPSQTRRISPLPRSHSAPRGPPPIQTSVSRMSQQPTPASTPGPSSDEGFQRPPGQPAAPSNEEVEALRRENEELRNQLMVAREAAASNEQLTAEAQLHGDLVSALERLTRREREAAKRAQEIVNLRQKIKSFETAQQAQSTLGPRNEILDQELNDLRASQEAQTQQIELLQRKLKRAETRIQDSNGFANRAESHVLELEANLRDLVLTSTAASNKQKSTIDEQKRQISSLHQTINEMNTAMEKLKSSRGDAINSALSEIHHMQKTLRITSEQQTASHYSMPPPPHPHFPHPSPNFRVIPPKYPANPGELQDANSALKTQRAEIEALKKQLGQAKAQIENSAQANLQIEQSLEVFRRQHHNHELVVSALQGDLEKKDCEIRTLNARHDADSMLIRDLEGRLGHLYQQCHAIDAELARVKKEYESCRQELDKTLSATASNLGCFDEAQAVINELKGQQVASEAHIANLAKSLASAMESEAASQREREVLKEELATLQAKYERDVEAAKPIIEVLMQTLKYQGNGLEQPESQSAPTPDLEAVLSQAPVSPSVARPSGSLLELQTEYADEDDQMEDTA